MAYRIEGNNEVFMTWQREVFCPKMNVLMREACDELMGIGIEEKYIEGVAIASFLGFAMAYAQLRNNNKDAVMKDCSDIYDNAAAALKLPEARLS